MPLQLDTAIACRPLDHPVEPRWSALGSPRARSQVSALTGSGCLEEPVAGRKIARR